ncbi:MAG: sigma-54 dependent transcriptional regulator [Planctomycetia bacterium]|jgi:DNA-binding NtrC family response regulator
MIQSNPRYNSLPSDPGRVLVVDDHRQARESMSDVLRQSGHDVDCCASAPEALERIVDQSFDCVITDLQMPGMDGVEFIVQLKRRKYPAQVVMVTAHASVNTAVEAMRHGAFDYIEKPFDIDRLEQLINRAIRQNRLLGVNKEETTDISKTPPVMIGSSEAMQRLRQRIEQIAPTPETVLIMGESGTGKELVARAIHLASTRPDGPMVSLNCPVLSAQLMESELFGHEKGAFTGAETKRTGRFEMANGGSILLDEVTEIDLGLQAKLLRVLQEHAFERVGSSETIKVDVRVLATTNRNLLEEVASERFRQDLYYRLAVVPVWVPPLRERLEDVPELVEHFLLESATRLDRSPCRLTKEAEQLLYNYHWPGNVRELENLITRVSVLCPTDQIDAEQIRSWMQIGPEMQKNVVPTVAPTPDCIPFPGPAAQESTPEPEPAIPVGTTLQETERALIEATLAHFDGHRAKTAEALGIGVRTLSGKLRQYGYAPRANKAG